jgi:hypothetical protein
MTKLTGLPRGLRAPGGMLAAEPFDKWPTRVLLHVEWGLGKVEALRDAGRPDRRQDAWDSVQLFADQCLGLCEQLELPSAARDFEFIRDDLSEGRLTDHFELAYVLDKAARSFRADLEERYFFRVAADKKASFGAGFGEAVTNAFPSAVYDIREANTCFALERYIASMLHAVRAAEVGLHALAKERGIRCIKGPVQWHEWGEIIREIKTRADAHVANWSRGPEKDEFLHFYSGAVGELSALKDVYRNVMMHTRPNKKPPGETEARDALDDVRGLLQRLCNRLTEKGHKIRWKKP